MDNLLKDSAERVYVPSQSVDEDLYIDVAGFVSCCSIAVPLAKDFPVK